MAIDLNKPIGAPSGASTSSLPSKTYINLLVHEKKASGLWKYLLAALLLALLVGLFAKFAVFDVFAQVGLKQTELHAAQMELEAAQQQLGDYEATLEEYRSYTGITQGDVIDALDVFDMVAASIQPKATVTAASTSGGALVVNVKDISLDDLGKLADALRAEPLVESVVVDSASDSTAGAEEQENTNVSATLRMTLVSAGGEGEQ